MVSNCSVITSAYNACNSSFAALSTAFDACGCPAAAADAYAYVDPCAVDTSVVYGQSLHIAAIFIVLIASSLGAGIPLLSKYHPGFSLDPYVICLGKCMGTGVILACALVHMLQPSNQSLTSECVPYEFNTDYPAYAFLYAMLAALVMQFVEVGVGFMIGAEAPIGAQSSGPRMVDRYPQHGHGGHGVAESDPGFMLDNAVMPRSSTASGNASASDEATVSKIEAAGSSGKLALSPTEKLSLMHRMLSVYMVEFGVTVHSVFIGLATGVVGIDELKALLVALCFHQFFEGVALGSRLADADLPSHWQEAFLSLVFSFAAPIGLVVGVCVTTSLNVAGRTFLLVQGTFDGVCAGLLLYLGFSLIFLDFPADMRKFCAGKKNELGMRGGMFCALWLGAGLMAFIGKYL